MSSGIENIGVVQTIAVKPASANPSTAPVVAADPTSSTIPSVKLNNERVIQDPVAGFITQYLSNNDAQVIGQSPSAVTVAYLKLGLTADGLTKQAANEIRLATTA